MKFGSHLEWTISHTPQWRSKFLSYKGLKRLIKKLRVAQSAEGQRLPQSESEDSEGTPLLRRRLKSTHLPRSVASLKAHPADVELGDPFLDAVREFLALLASECRKVIDFYDRSMDEFNQFVDQQSGTSKSPRPEVTKDALFLLYRKLEHLNHFFEVNKLAVKKIVKKYNKNVPESFQVSASDFTVNWNRADHDALTHRVEEVTAELYFDGNLRTARAALISQMQHHFSHGDAFGLGFFLGWLLPSLFLLLYAVRVTATDEDILHFYVFIPIYRMFGCIVLVLWCWGFDLYIFEHYRINHAYIFQFNPVRHLSSVQALKVAGFFTVLYVICLTAHFAVHVAADPNPIVLSHHWMPLIFAAILLSFLFFPLRVAMWDTRLFLLKKFGNLIALPFGRVGFCEFFLGDQLTSLTIPIADLHYTMCYYIARNTAATPEDPQHATQCATLNDHTKFALTFIPFFWRLTQCLRMYRATHNRVHVINAGKYGSFLAVILSGAAYSNWDSPRGILVFASCCAELYAFIWDVLMDWGWVRGKKRERLFSWTWLYPVIMVCDLLLRFTFLLTPAQGAIVPRIMSVRVLVCVLAAAEILRRAVWNIFRVENEMVNNLESYRSIDFVPSPVTELHDALGLA